MSAPFTARPRLLLATAGSSLRPTKPVFCTGTTLGYFPTSAWSTSLSPHKLSWTTNRLPLASVLSSQHSAVALLSLCQKCKITNAFFVQFVFFRIDLINDNPAAICHINDGCLSFFFKIFPRPLTVALSIIVRAEFVNLAFFVIEPIDLLPTFACVSVGQLTIWRTVGAGVKFFYFVVCCRTSGGKKKKETKKSGSSHDCIGRTSEHVLSTFACCASCFSHIPPEINVLDNYVAFCDIN